MADEQKIDLFRMHKDDYLARKKPVIVDIKAANYLMISGQGAPGEEEFQEKIGALYGMAFTVKMTRKFDGRQDFVVCKLEGQWWAPDAEEDMSDLPKEQWCWTLMIRVPDFVSQDEVHNAASALLGKGKSPLTKEVTLSPLEEGRCVQMLHVGPYEKETETIAVMKAFAEEQGYVSRGRHHEIYLSDPRRVPPERLKTILRMPVEKGL